MPSTNTAAVAPFQPSAVPLVIRHYKPFDEVLPELPLFVNASYQVTLQRTGNAVCSTSIR